MYNIVEPWNDFEKDVKKIAVQSAVKLLGAFFAVDPLLRYVDPEVISMSSTIYYAIRRREDSPKMADP